MPIQKGEKIPDVTLKVKGEGGLEDVSTAGLFKGKKVVMFAVPGAFTPTCSQKHLPDYLNNLDALKSKGVDEVICLAVNDPFVMNHWADVAGTKGKIRMLPDGNGEFTKALDLGLDGSGHGLGFRAQRFMLIAEDGVVQELEVEENPGELKNASAGVCLAKL